MSIVAFDTETRGLDWFDPDQRAFLATWADEHGEYCADLSDPAQVAQFRQAVEGADVLIAHNAKFDLHHVREALGLDLSDKIIHDTDVLSRVVHPEGNRGNGGGHGLKALAKVFLRADAGDEEAAIKEMAKSIGLRTIKAQGAYYEVYRAYPDVMKEYAIADARHTYDLYQKFAAALGDLRSVYELEMAVLPVLLRAEQRGVLTDQAAVQRLNREYLDRLIEVEIRLATEGLGPEQLGGKGSEEALIETLLKLGVPLHKKTRTGQIATDKYALQEFVRDFPVIEDLFEYRRLEKFLATYIGAVDGREVVHASFRQCEAWTGRMSCSSPNMQNLPKRAGKEVRSVFVPRPGHAFVVCDYDSIEIRLLAYYLGDAGFRQLIADGHDPHAWMATNIWGGAVSDYAKDGPQDDKRSLAKNALFAITYGAGAPRVRNMLRDYGEDATVEQAKAIISSIKASLPGYYKLMKRIRHKIETVGYVNTIMGRKNPVAKDKSYVGLNALIQGSAADVMKRGLVYVDQAVAPLGGVPLLVVHDEVVVEVPILNAEEVMSRTTRALEAAYKLDPPLKVSGSIVTTSYADA